MFEFIEKLVITFSWIWSIIKVYIIYYIPACTNPMFGKNLRYSKDQNALGQSDCKILKSNSSLEQNNEIAWYFACWNKLMEIISWLKNTGVGVVKNGFGHSCCRTLKLAVSQEGNNGINWFLACWDKSRKAKSYCNNCWVGMSKNEFGLLILRTLKFAVSLE